MPTIQLNQKQITENGGVVVLTLEEYHRLKERAVPTFYLKGMEARMHDDGVVRALREHAGGKTKKIRSMADIG